MENLTNQAAAPSGAPRPGVAAMSGWRASLTKGLLFLSEGQWITAIVVLSVLLRVLTVLVLEIDPVGDYRGYDDMARNLAAGRTMMDEFGNVAFLSGGYPLLFLAPIYMLFGHELLVVQIGNALLGGLSTWLVYLLLCEAKAGKAARIGGPLLFALYIPAWIYCEYLAKENLMTPALLLLLWSSARLYQRLTPRAALAAGASIGMLGITGSAALAVLPLSIAAILLAPASLPAKLRSGALVLLVSAIVLAPWQYRNAQLTGSPVLNTNGGFNLYLGNNPKATGLYLSVADTPMAKAWTRLRAQGELLASERLKAEALDWIRAHPGSFAQLALKKAGLFWLPPIHEGKGPQSTMEKASRWVWLLQYLLLCGCALYVVFSVKGRNRIQAGLIASLVLYTGVHMLFYVIFRYREPIMPVVIVLAAIGVEDLVRRLAARRVPHADGIAAPQSEPLLQ